MKANRVLKPLIVSGPSGCGKSTLISHLLGLHPRSFELSVSHTTRTKRPKENEGFHYYFVRKEEFEAMIKNHGFLEYEEVHGNYYGTSMLEISRISKKNMIPLLDIDIKGAINIHRNSRLESPNFLFVMTKDIETLRERLTRRGTETQENLEKRVHNAMEEIRKAKESGIYGENGFIYNEELEKAKKDFVSRIIDLYKL